MASNYVFDKHDLGITDPSSSDLVGMMLAKKKDGTPVWDVYDDEYLASQFYTGTPGYSNLPPEKELAIRQDDWRSGAGLEIFDSSDDKRYYTSYGCDLRFRNMAIAGPIATGIAIPASITATITNGDMEAAANWTNGAQSAVQVHGGAWSWAPGAGVTTYQDAVTWDNAWRGRAFLFTCWVWDSQASGRIGINDGVGTTYSSAHTGDSTWQLLYVIRVLDAAATRCRLYLEDPAAASAYFDDATLYAPTTGKPLCFAEFNDALYIALGKTLVKLNGTGNGFTDVAEFPATITDIEPFTDDRLYIAQGTSDPYWYMSTAEVCTKSTAAVTGFNYFKTVHTATPTLWGSDSANTIRSNTNPINGGAAWSGQTTVGSSYHAITELVTKSGALYIMKEDMPYYLDSTGAVQNDLAPEMATMAASTNGKNTKIWLNEIFVPCGTQSLLRIGSSNSWATPATQFTNASDFNGQVQALAYDDQYLFAILDNSTKVEVMAGRNETVDGTTSWLWHGSLAEITLTGCETAYVSSVYQKRLWIASTSASESLYYIPLPTGYANVTADANRTFLTTTYFITPWLHGNFRDTVKMFYSLTLALGHAYDADIYWTAAYELLEDTTWTTIGNFDGTAASRIETINIPDDAGSNHPQSTAIRFKFTAVTDSTTTTPILLSYKLRALLVPSSRTLISCTVRDAQEVTNKQGIAEKNMYTTIKDAITNARAATWPVSIRDIDGATQTVKFLPLGRNVPQYTVVKDEKGRVTERYYNLLMQVI